MAIKLSTFRASSLSNPVPATKKLEGKSNILINNPNSAGAVILPVSDLITLDRARLLLEDKIRQLFWQVDNRVLNPVIQASLATLQPNLEYDQLENERRLNRINREFPSQYFWE